MVALWRDGKGLLTQASLPQAGPLSAQDLGWKIHLEIIVDFVKLSRARPLGSERASPPECLLPRTKAL